MAAPSRGIHPVMVGTAGHIDHGKSSLVLALTGIDPDRLKEEKERGLTIDIGFARMRLRDGRLVGMVDVPGHERFVRNMVAGSTALDLALLVVAADDGVMPQTLEHLDILDLVGVRRGLVALTKVDLVDEEVAALAEAEVEELVASSGLAGSPIVRCSSATGEGVDRVRGILEELAAATPPRPSEGAFRMPVQRVFKLEGIGTVATGVPISGSVAAGDTVEFLPGGHRSKVRAVQAFGGPVERAFAGHSTALSVPDARDAGLTRGVVACEPGVFRTGDAVDVSLRLTTRTGPVEHRREVRFHTGTGEVQGALLLLDRDRIEAGQEAVARIVLEQDVCCAPGDPFLLRLQNPPVTVGGGNVVRILRAPRRYRRRQVGEELQRLEAAGGSMEERVLEELTQAGAAGLSVHELAARTASGRGEVEAILAAGEDVHLHGSRAFLRSVLEEGIEELLRNVERMLRDKPLAASVRRASFRPGRALPAVLLDAVLDELQRRGRVRAGTQGRVLFVERLRPLPAEAQRRLDRLVTACEGAGFRPPSREDLARELGEPAAALEDLLARAIDEGRVEPVGDTVFGGSVLRRALHAIRRNCLAHGGELDIPALRDELGTSRKFLIPLLEHIDGLGLTRLRGGTRILLSSSTLARELAEEAAEGSVQAD